MAFRVLRCALGGFFVLAALTRLWRFDSALVQESVLSVYLGHSATLLACFSLLELLAGVLLASGLWTRPLALLLGVSVGMASFTLYFDEVSAKRPCGCGLMLRAGSRYDDAGALAMGLLLSLLLIFLGWTAPNPRPPA